MTYLYGSFIGVFLFFLCVQSKGKTRAGKCNETRIYILYIHIYSFQKKKWFWVRPYTATNSSRFTSKFTCKSKWTFHFHVPLFPQPHHSKKREKLLPHIGGNYCPLFFRFLFWFFLFCLVFFFLSLIRLSLSPPNISKKKKEKKKKVERWQRFWKRKLCCNYLHPVQLGKKKNPSTFLVACIVENSYTR